jgi:hypothetical protein
MQTTHSRRLARASAGFASALALCAAASAQQATPRAHFGKGARQATLAAGYAEGFPLVADGDEDAANVRAAGIVARWGAGISRVKGENAWYEGAFAAGLEAQLLRETHPHDGLGGGLVLDLRYDFLRSERVVPFVAIGAGVGGIDFDLADQADGFNFLLQGGFGAHVLVRPGLAISVEARWHHISNAQLRERNHGVNTALLLLGPTWFWR